MATVYAISGSALLAQRQRLNLIASNIANADSTTSSTGQPYRARFAVMAAQPLEDGSQGSAGSQGVRVSRVLQSRAPFKRIYDPGNPAADAQGYVTGSDVSMVRQMVDMVDATRSYRANMAMLAQNQQLDRALIGAL